MGVKLRILFITVRRGWKHADASLHRPKANVTATMKVHTQFMHFERIAAFAELRATLKGMGLEVDPAPLATEVIPLDLKQNWR